MIRINLLPVREARRKADLRQQLVVLAGAVVGAMALAWLVHTFVSRDISNAQSRLTQLQVQLQQYEPRKAEIEEFKAKKSEIERKLGVIEGLEQSRSGPVRVLDELSTHIPDRVWLTSLKTEAGRIEIDGMSLDNELVAMFLTALESSPFFRGVELEATELKQVDELKLNTFRIRAMLVLPSKGQGASQHAAAHGSSL